MKLKQVVKSRRNWVILGLALAQIFGIQIPDVISNSIHTII